MSALDLLGQAHKQIEQAQDLIEQAEDSISQPSPPPVQTDSQRSIRRTWLGIFNTDLFDYTRAARFDTFVAHYFDSWANQGAKYRSANPQGDCLVYCNVGTAGGASAISLETARSNGWLAKHNGAEIPNPWGGSAFVVDVGKPGVVDAYIGAIVAKWGSSRWTGIFADDANCWANLWRNGQSIDGYVSYGDWWTRAMREGGLYLRVSVLRAWIAELERRVAAQGETAAGRRAPHVDPSPLGEKTIEEDLGGFPTSTRITQAEESPDVAD